MGGMPAHVLNGFSLAKRDEARGLASEVADGYARPFFAPPFTNPGADWKLRVAFLTIYFLASQLGASPEGADAYIVKNYDDALRWLEGVQKGTVKPSSTDDATPGLDDVGGPDIISAPPRGW